MGRQKMNKKKFPINIPAADWRKIKELDLRIGDTVDVALQKFLESGGKVRQEKKMSSYVSTSVLINSLFYQYIGAIARDNHTTMSHLIRQSLGDYLKLL
jgi:hypothetical protein